MARLVARSLRVERSALMQVGSTSGVLGHYRISYLVPLLMWTGPCVLVAPEPLQQTILMVEVPKLQDKLPCIKPIQVGDRWPDPGFQGILLTTPEAWLADRLNGTFHIPQHIPTVIDGADHLERWVQNQLTVSLRYADWVTLARAFPNHSDTIHNLHVALVHGAFQHPPNPYQCHLLDADNYRHLHGLRQVLTDAALAPAIMPPQWQCFWQQFNPPDHLLWFSLDRDLGTMTLHCGPVHLANVMQSVWACQPTVLIAAAVDAEAKAPTFRNRLGLAEVTCLKFSQPRQFGALKLYLPDGLPLPNTPNFQPAAWAEIRRILGGVPPETGKIVIIVDDVPLKGQLAAALAAEFGSRVKVEQLDLPANGILVSGWDFWRSCQGQMSAPGLMIITTLPIPSLEDPLVAGRVAYYKRQRQDWFRLYLLPRTLTELQQAIAPLRVRQGAVALLDSRVHYRSYGRQILDALSPTVCSRSLTPDWLAPDWLTEDNYL